MAEIICRNGWNVNNKNVVNVNSIGIVFSGTPAHKFHLVDGNLFITGGGETSFIMKRESVVGSGPNESTNPIFYWGRISGAGDGSPEVKVLFSDDSIAERVVMKYDNKGIIASVKQTVGSHFEGFIEGHVEPFFRLNSYNGSGTGMTLELGPGGSDITDVYFRRTTDDTSPTASILTGGTRRMFINGTRANILVNTAITGTLDVSGALSFASLAGKWEISGNNFLPLVTSAYDIGSTLKRVATVYATGLNVDGTAGINGTLILGASFAGNTSIEIGNSSHTGGIAFIDFHYGVGFAQDYNIRMTNPANNEWYIQESTGDFVFGIFSKSFGFNYIANGGGTRTFALGNVGTLPSGPATGGIILYIENDLIKYLDSTGTVKVVATV